MNPERPSLPEKPASSGPKKRTFLDRVFRHLPAGSRNIAGAMALGAMEIMSDKPGTQEQVEALSQADETIQEERKEQIKRDMEAAEAAEQTEQLAEIRKKIRNG